MGFVSHLAMIMTTYWQKRFWISFFFLQKKKDWHLIYRGVFRDYDVSTYPDFASSFYASGCICVHMHVLVHMYVPISTPDTVILDSLSISYWQLKQEIDPWRPWKIRLLIDTQVKADAWEYLFLTVWIYCVFCHKTLSETCMLPILLHADLWSICYLLQ